MEPSLKSGRFGFMCKYLLKRLGSSLIVLFLVSVIIFVLIHSQPGNPFASMISHDTDPAFVAERMEAMGYNDLLPMRYVKWILKREITVSFPTRIKTITEMIEDLETEIKRKYQKLILRKFQP